MVDIMARCPTGTKYAESPKPYISLQDAIVHMIQNPSDCITNQSVPAGILLQSERNNESPSDETSRRPHSEGGQQQGIHDTDELHASNTNDKQQDYSSENREERQRHSLESRERARNELTENETAPFVDHDIETDSIESLSDSDYLAQLTSSNNLMADSFHLPPGCRIKRPLYQTFRSRLGTFKNWPSHLTQRPKDLAYAGFYSLGVADVVRCFSCDGGLKNWEPEDDPWIEHARWFSDCDFLRHVKDDEFIQLVRLMDEEESADENEQASVNDKEQAASYMQALNLGDNQEPSVLDADCAQSVVQTGFSNISVARAINNLLEEGKEEFGSQDILTVILDEEEEGSLLRKAEQSPPFTGRRMNFPQNEAAMPLLLENDTLKRQKMCTECGQHDRNVLFLPCRHHTVCDNCSQHIHVCYVCFRRVRQKVKTYMS